MGPSAECIFVSTKCAIDGDLTWVFVLLRF
jgi:hypothetical protein